MRVLVDAVQYGPQITGTDRLARDVLRALHQRHPALELVVCAHASHTFVVDGLDVELRRYPGRQQGRWTAHALGAAARDASADVVLSFHNCVGPLSGPLPSVVSVLDVIPFRDPSQYFSSAARARAGLALARRAVRRAARVVAISEHSASEAIDLLGARPERITVTPLAAEDRFVRPGAQARSAARSAFDLPLHYVLALGGDEPRKNNAAVIAAHGSLPTELRERYPLVLAGPSSGTAGDAVLRLGPVPDALLPGLYAEASLFVLASLVEGFGLPALEAMSAGVATVLAGTSSLPEVGGDAALYVDPRSISDITEVMYRALSDDDLRMRLSAAGARRADGFSWDRTADSYAAALRDAVVPA